MHVHSKDQVVVISGKDKGMQPGGIVHKEAPIDASNVMLVCPKCGKGTRVARKVVVVEENGVKKRKIIRVCKQKGCGAEID